MKHIYFSISILSIFIITNAYGQPVIKAQRVTGGDGNDWLTSIYLTKDGGIIGGGYSVSSISGEKTENSRGYEDYWIVKLDSSNNLEWNKTIGGSGSDFLVSLQQTKDNGYIQP